VILHVRLTPKAAADRIDGWLKDADERSVLAARVRAAPVEGAANAALEGLIARALGVPRSSVRVTRGGQSRLKAVEVKGLDQATAERAFGTP
jgi:uncharacterized protein YggU (UPF0235/DUF167 family)